MDDKSKTPAPEREPDLFAVVRALKAIKKGLDDGKSILDDGMIGHVQTVCSDEVEVVLAEMTGAYEARSICQVNGWQWVPCTLLATNGAAEPGPGIARVGTFSEYAYLSWTACAIIENSNWVEDDQ